MSDTTTIRRLRDHLEFDAGQFRELAGDFEALCDVDPDLRDLCRHCYCLALAAAADDELAALEEA